jgi:uncharacterized membrane protein YphA (DoxX/SURF4 family)
MPAFITFGRILFAVLFIYSGATKLFGIQATADFIAAKVAVPALLALNFGARFFSILLIFFVGATIFYFNDFWNQSPPENAKTLMDALKSLSIIGALFMIAGYGRAPRNAEPAYGDV